MKVLFGLLVIGALAAPLASTATAAGGSDPCVGDVATLCKGVKPGGGRILACLKEHESSVSPTCKAHLTELKGKLQEAQQACRDDVEQFCSEVKPGGMRIVKCLKQHQAELSSECREIVQRRKMP